MVSLLIPAIIFISPASNHPDGYDMFLRKYDSAGAFQWMRTYNSGGGINDEGNGVTIDSGNNIYVTGYETTGRPT